MIDLHERVRPRSRRLREGEVNHRLFLRDLDALDFFQFFDATLHLLRFGRLVAKAADECLKMFNLVALVLVGVFKLQAALGLLRQVFLVIAVIDVDVLVPDLDDLVDCHVEEVAIVRDQDVALGVRSQIVFEPVAGLQVEMVRRLVEQQKIGLLEEQLGERDAHLPATGELFSPPLPVFLAESETAQHRATTFTSSA